MEIYYVTGIAGHYVQFNQSFNWQNVDIFLENAYNLRQEMREREKKKWFNFLKNQLFYILEICNQTLID